MTSNPTTKIEVMAPVGSYESLQAAIQGGANAIYFGVGNLNMRSRSAANFNLEDLAKIADIARQHGVRSYLTLNTIIYNNEIEEMHAMVQAAKEAGISAIIASDLAVITYAHRQGVEGHISTQCNISNIEAVRFYAQFADVIVTARELPLSQVAEITQYILDNDIRGPKGELLGVEIFAHGALCMSISSKCYLSLVHYNYSANRGACLQLCRREYLVRDVESNNELLVSGKYIMSPKDLCTIGFVDKIVKAGVCVLKIEGRGRSADYVRIVTECYREAVDAVAEGTYTPEKIAAWTERLRTVFNRGFWDGYYLGRTMGEWSERYGSQATENKVFLGLVTNYFNKISVAETHIQTDQELHEGDKIMITGSTTGVYTATLQAPHTDKGTATVLHQGEVFTFKTSEPVHRGDKIYRVDTVVDEF